MKRVLIVDGHPDPDPQRFCHALCASYRDGARQAGHTVEEIALARMDLPMLRTREEWEQKPPPDGVRAAQAMLRSADHVLLVFPLWLGDVPALVKAFLEQVLRPGFAFAYDAGESLPRKLLRGKSVRIVVTMGMPAFVYRWYFGAHSLRSLKRNVFAFVGMRAATTLIGGIESIGDERRKEWLGEMHQLGARAR